ncbi:MAG: TonB-dependent receptor [Deltaproteobacteria bacterium]|nr:TonB-dependent receptor [Deltaproteobacteria bacterium]
MIFRSLLTVSLLVANLGVARAEEPEEVAAGLGTDEVDGEVHHTVVTPDRRERLTFETPSQVLVVDLERLRREMPLDVPDALQGLPGVMTQRTNRGAATPILRGFVGPENLLLVDGVRLNTSIFRTGPNQYAAMVDPQALDRVEVVLGPGSVLYGTDAMGGTINHITLGYEPRGDAPIGGEVAVQGASVDLGAAALGRLWFSAGDLDGWARVGYRHHGELTTGTGATWPLSAYDQIDWGGKGRLFLGSDWRLEIASLGSRIGDAGRTDSLGRGDVRFYDNLDSLSYVRLERRSQDDALARLVGTVALHFMTEDETRRRCTVGDDSLVTDRAGCLAGEAEALRSDNQVRQDDVLALLVSASGELRFFDERLAVLVGLDGVLETIGSRRVDDPEARGNFSDGSTYSTLDAWAWLDATLLGPAAVRSGEAPRAWRLKLAGGARGTGVFASAPDVPGLGDVDYDFAGVVGAARLSALWGGDRDGLHLWTGVSQGFRAPNLQETTVLGDTGSTFEVPNDDLAPQRNATFEVGLRLAGERSALTLVGYTTRVDDAIVRERTTFEGEAQVDGKDVFRRVNATRVDYRGLEAQVVVSTPLRGLVVEGAVGVVDGRLVEVDGDETAPRRLPPLQGKVALSWRSEWKRLRLEGGVLFSSAQRHLAGDDRTDLRICGDRQQDGVLLADCDGTDGWADVYLGASIMPTDALALRLRVENVLDQGYRVHGSGYDAPGIGVELGATYRFE